MSSTPMDNGLIAKSAKSTEANEETTKERFYLSRVSFGDGRFRDGRERAYRHVASAYADAQPSAEEQFSRRGCPLYRAAADQDDWERRGLSGLRYRCSRPKLQRHTDVGRAGN